MWGIVSISLLCSLIASVQCQDPIVTITETDPDTIAGIMEAERDTDVIMSCLVENKQAANSVRWKNTHFTSTGDLQFNTISIDMDVTNNIKYSIEKPTAFTWRLRVKDTQIKDEGNYTCFVYTTRDNVKEANRTLKVAVVPYFNPEQTSSDMTVKQGDTIDILCNATGRPPPTIQWTRLGGALLPIGKEMHFDTKLTVVNVMPQDRGAYRCRAFNMINREVREIIRDIQLEVKFPPIVQAVHPVVYQSLGCYRIELQCYIEANPFPSSTTMMWIKGQRVISQSIGRYTVKSIEGAFNRLTYELIINGVEETDYGQYRCQIKNSEGSGLANVELRRSEGPTPSMKLGRIVTCGVTHAVLHLSTVLVSLLLWFALN